MIASWNLKEKKIIWDKHNCHLGAIAGEGVTRERPSMARGGGGSTRVRVYSTIQCTYKLHVFNGEGRGGGGWPASIQPVD